MMLVVTQRRLAKKLKNCQLNCFLQAPLFIMGCIWYPVPASMLIINKSLTMHGLVQDYSGKASYKSEIDVLG